VPYVKPGLALTQTIVRSVLHASDTPDVIVLGNHGLVVAADTVQDAGDLLYRVCAALSQPQRDSAAADFAELQQLAAASEYRQPANPRSHATAMDPDAALFAAGGSLYPDHVIFLGAGTRLAQTGQTAVDVQREFAQRQLPLPKQILFPGYGTLLHNSADRSTEALALCLADVTTRIAAAAPVNYLSAEQDDELLNWDAEKYRQSLNQNSQ